MRILLETRDPEVISQLSALLKPQHDLVETASEDVSLVDATSRLAPDVVILDVALAELGCLEAAKLIKASMPSTRLIFLSKSDCQVTIYQAIDAGADGYIRMAHVKEDLLPVVEDVQDSGAFDSLCLSSGGPNNRGGKGEERYRVIIADDDADIQDELIQLLSANSDLVATVGNGRELVNLAHCCKPHVVVVDIAMPEMNGFQAVQQMKSDGVESKIIFFTTNGSPHYVRKAFSLGANGYVLKALGAEELPAAVKVVLDGGTFVSPSIAVDF